MIQSYFKYICVILLGFAAGQLYLEKHSATPRSGSQRDGLGTMPFVALIRTPLVIKVELKELRASVSHAEIVLSKGLRFYSDQFPEISSLERLELSWESQNAPAILPIVVQSETAGSEMVNVKLLNSQNQVLSERVFQLRIAPQLAPHLVQRMKTSTKAEPAHS